MKTDGRSPFQRLKSPHNSFRFSPKNWCWSLRKRAEFEFDHLNLSPALCLVTWGSPSLLAGPSEDLLLQLFQLLWPQVPAKMATAAAWQQSSPAQMLLTNGSAARFALDQSQGSPSQEGGRKPITTLHRFFSTPARVGLFCTIFTEIFIHLIKPSTQHKYIWHFTWNSKILWTLLDEKNWFLLLLL